MSDFIKKKDCLVCDVEVYPNSFMIGFKSTTNGKVVQYNLYGVNDKFDDLIIRKINSLMNKYTIVTFNGTDYDIPIINYALKGATCDKIFRVSSLIIKDSMISWQSNRKFGLSDRLNLVHIDLMPIAKGQASLKMYGARIDVEELQDLPYPFDTNLTKSEFEEVRLYNIKDLNTTLALYSYLKENINLRYDMSNQYKLNLISKSDPQIAETILIHELKKKNINAKRIKLAKDYSFNYIAPNCITFKTNQLKDIFEKIKKEKYTLSETKKINLPDWLKKTIITIGNTNYNIGVGGLHSQEKKLVVKPNQNQVLGNIDVASYYPSMIIEYGWTPVQFGSTFLEIYTKLYWDRNHPKTGYKVTKQKVLSDTVKLILNSSFGKLSEQYSKLFAPDLLLHITFTGQLLLLMLIEELYSHGITIISANTDGLEYLCNKVDEDKVKAIVFDWELSTGMVMEFGQYKALYARDVNNYIAIYDGYVKSKGIYGEPSIDKNVFHRIVFRSISEYLLNNTPIKDTIYNCNDIKQFVCSKKVTGGGTWRGTYLGKIVRWYYSIDGDVITYSANGNKVGDTNRAKPMMDLPTGSTLPADLDKDYYVQLAYKHLRNLGVLDSYQEEHECYYNIIEKLSARAKAKTKTKDNKLRCECAICGNSKLFEFTTDLNGLLGIKHDDLIKIKCDELNIQL